MADELILIAEDDPDIRQMLIFALESAGYRTVAATDGRTALRLLGTAAPAALVTDVRMPGLNGMELCRLVRRDPRLRDLPVVMVSAHAHTFDVAAGLAAGADAYLLKPLSPRELARRLRDLLDPAPVPG